MNAMLKKQWHWIVRHTWVNVNGTKILVNETIDAAYVSFNSEAVEYGKARHALKPNVVLTALPCNSEDDRKRARELNHMVSTRIAECEAEMHFIEQRMH